ncbi:endolytic transglycosylase MltG [Kingella negevensis]|uniref:Endolytic murein transglycosylase n=1 Tax=Kingella negevensis TaxID=1522312 RepID=A0A238TDJ7_9NEIS|nr:endolytic transglycosylase MltG [Kingella negevensis]MDK4679753.1 endolytic transglycosylase MltG [Kingella negevensis]MDK4682529.1 endolytic transglycosylase MltG [Kingella negevensis]MDK4690725.1 endolytic transglycosylase MltG [Kingella negevensis]MDK4694127.1 endolytic transglycosylase MltG [Kingella negevensis]MDK4696911.1 endolytic transglycosylase MltG [Kingella negevensis]
MSAKVKFFLLFLPLTAIGVAATLLFYPKNNGLPYRIVVEKGQGISAVSRKLADDKKVYSRPVLMAAAYFLGVHDKLTNGSYRLPARVSAWEILQKLQKNSPDSVRVQIVEGMRFSQMRRVVNQMDNIRHDTKNMTDEELLHKVTPNPLSDNPEGLFFPDSYEIAAGSSDLQIFKASYKAMERELKEAWDDRDAALPYNMPYELLIMASLIEKETAHEDDRRDVAAVFRNRLEKNMRLQTDPTVIYGMGSAYTGRIRKADLQRDTPYNTYTRHGLPPTPIALPSKAALEAAASPAKSDYLYFVSRMDNTGKSQFSRTLDEHNQAVRQYILKKK